MSVRENHVFEFSAKDIVKQALAEASYHQARIKHWQDRYDTASQKVKHSVGAKVVETTQTGGLRSLTVVVDYGDQEAWNEATLAHRKLQEHTKAADRFHTDVVLYSSQDPYTKFNLDADDVFHYRLGDQARAK